MDIYSRSLWERDYLDLWTIVHLLTGMCFGFAIFFYSSPFRDSFIIFTVFVILWEVIEHFHGVGEPLTNQTTDVISGVLGFLITAYVIPILASSLSVQIAYFTVVYTIAWVLAYYGFQSFALHSNKDVEKYKNSFWGAAIIYIAIVLAILILKFL